MENNRVLDRGKKDGVQEVKQGYPKKSFTKKAYPTPSFYQKKSILKNTYSSSFFF